MDAGLFNTKTPYEQQQDLINQKAAAFAAQTGEQQIGGMAYKAGAGLGNVVSGMFGIQDPAMQRASFMQNASKQFNITTSDGLLKMAQAASQQGYGDEAMKAMKASTEMEKQESLRTLEAARADFFKKRSVAGGAAAGILGKLRPEAYTPDSLSEFSDSVQAGKPDYSLLELRDPVAKAQALSPAGKQASEEGLAPGTQAFMDRVKDINIDKVAKPLPASLVKEMADTAQKVVSLQNSGTKLDSLIPTVLQMDLGVVSNIFRSGASALGINTEDRTKFDAMQRMVQNEANKELLLAKGQQTEGDAVRVHAAIMSPDTWKNADALRAALSELKTTQTNTLKELEARQGVLSRGGQITSRTGPTQAAPAQVAPSNSGINWEAAFAKQQALNPAWKNFTLEQFKQKAGAR